jgi:eukaryotic-like serine/threonine-protein kinase
MEHGREIEPSGTDLPSDVQGETVDAFAIGELVNERYSVRIRISEGPSGKLYRARDMRTESDVTLKLLLGWSGLDDTVVRRLTQELSPTRTLKGTQSNLALVHGCDLTPDGRAFVVMEALAGRNLADLIRWREPLSVERAVRLALQIARGLHAAHGLRLVHGALSPEHVFVQQNDTVKVMGFEVARLPAPTGASSHRRSERTDVLTEAADIRAVAVVLLEMLGSGVRPGPREAAAPPEASRGGETPVRIKQLVMQALVTSQEPPSMDMGALVKALSAELSPRPERRSSRALRRARSSPRRRERVLIAAAGLAAVASASTGWMAWSLISTSRHPGARVRALPTQSVISEPVSSIPDGATLPPAPDSPAEAAAMPPIAPVKPAPDGPAEAAAMPPITPVKPAPDGPVEVAVMPPITPVIPLSSEHPASAASPPAGEGVAQPARVKQPPGVPPVADRSLPAAVESASARPPKAARPAPRSGAPRPESESPDPSAIIDWLIKAKGGPSEGP